MIIDWCWSWIRILNSSKFYKIVIKFNRIEANTIDPMRIGICGSIMGGTAALG